MIKDITKKSFLNIPSIISLQNTYSYRCFSFILIPKIRQILTKINL